MVDQALKHFQQVDPKMAQLAQQIKLEELVGMGNYLAHLCREITGQQLSGKVANVIFERFLELFSNREITPQLLNDLDIEQLRGVGMSYAKANTLKDLAAKILAGEVELEKFDSLSNDQVKSELVKVKGIGPWTAEMFLIFTLGRPDVFSPLDLGLRKGIQKVYDLPDLPTPKQAKELAEKWSPYRSLASRLLWKNLDN